MASVSRRLFRTLDDRSLASQGLVSIGLCEDEKAVVQDAMRALLSWRPQPRLELAIRRYRAKEVSFATTVVLLRHRHQTEQTPLVPLVG